MKYANIKTIEGISVGTGFFSFNVGDYMQNFAIDNLYDQMGIGKEDIVYISSTDVRDYIGEHLVLPIASMIGMMTDVPYIDNEGEIVISDYIIPVFLSISLYRDSFKFTQNNINYLIQHGPVGCRDWNTYVLMRQHSIPSYLSGCIAMTLPERSLAISSNKVYFVDAPEFIRNHVPKSYFDEARYVHHIVEISKECEEDPDYKWNYAYSLFQEYRDNAGLVITSRLHAACPCIASGIPTIVVREYKGYTFDWLDRFTKVYLKENVKDIEWDPCKAEYKKEKEMIANTAIANIRETVNKAYTHNMTDVYASWFGKGLKYEDCQKLPLDNIIDKLSMIWKDKKAKYLYSIWGVTETAESIYCYISKEYPNARLVSVTDTFRELTFHGIKTVKPESVVYEQKELVIVTSVNATNAAWDCFKRINKPKDEYLLMADVFMDNDEGEDIK